MQQNSTVSRKPEPARWGRAHHAKPASAKPASTTRAGARHPRAEQPAVPGVLAYLLVLTGVLVGLLIAFSGSKYTGRGMGLAGCALIAAALARLALPPRYVGLLASRCKVLDVLTFAVLGGAVLGLAVSLP